MSEYGVTGGKPLIMVVDDNIRNVHLVGSILEGEIDCDLICAGDGSDALVLARQHVPDLILLDVMMPKLDGFQTCCQLKADSLTADIPIIFLTAKDQADDVVRGFKLGAVDFVAKPFQVSELLARVRTQLKIKEQKDVIRRQNEERKQLIHVLCHDLSNPFSAIMGFLEMPNAVQAFPVLRPDLIEITENGMNLIDLVRRISSMEEKGAAITAVPIALLTMVEKARTLMMSRAENKSIKLVIDVDGNLFIKTEPISFVNTVINNLISNAVKFSPVGATVTLTGERDGDVAVLRVADQGIGMPDDILEHLFDIRKITTRLGTANETGTGFGMPLVKRFVEAGGGVISVESRAQEIFPDRHGTVVTIRMPLVAVTEASCS